MIQSAITNGEMYIASIDDSIVSAMVVNHKCEDGYSSVRWGVQADANCVASLHLLGVAPSMQRRGIATEMVAYAITTCRDSGMKALRLDVIYDNVPAQKLYSGMGFTHIETVKLFYEDTGLMDFMLYELPL